MADPKDDPLHSLKNLEFGIGQTADGDIETFPMSELPERRKQRDSQTEATAHAIKQAEAGFPEDDDAELLDTYAALAAAEPTEDEE